MFLVREWTTLTDDLGGESVAGGKIEAGERIGIA
jgi:hypothetical protein